MHLRTATLSFGCGLTTMYLAAPIITSPATPAAHYYDLSALPEELAAKYADADYLQSLIVLVDMRVQFATSKKAEYTARPEKALPAGVPDMPFNLKLFAPKTGSHWPKFEDPALQETLGRAKDDWVILNYWASWCAPCIAELPDMDQAAPKLAINGIQLVTVNVNHLGDDSAEKIESIFSAGSVSQLARLKAADKNLDEALSAAGLTRTSIGLPYNLVFAPGGEPFAYFTGVPKVPEGTEIWNSEELLAFFSALAATEV